jgi:hypothetical protein
MVHCFAFMDVDCRELSADRSGLAYRPRVEPLRPRLDALFAEIERLGAPLLFSTCCSGRMPRPGELEGVLHIPMDPEQKAWQGQVSQHRRFYLEKAACTGLPGVRTFDNNFNAAELARRLDVEAWVVFGNGLDFCVDHAVLHLLGLGRPVHFVPELLVSGAKGYGPSGTAENHARLIRIWRERGCRELPYADLFRLDARPVAAVSHA